MQLSRLQLNPRFKEELGGLFRLVEIGYCGVRVHRAVVRAVWELQQSLKVCNARRRVVVVSDRTEWFT